MEFLNTISNNRVWNKHGVHVAWAVALLCLLLALGRIAWMAYSERKTKLSDYQPQDIQVVTKSHGPGYRVNDLVAANLFGDPTPVKKVVKVAPKTTLDLTLQGILWASDPSLARAIIITGKKKSELYSVGEEIKGANASVKEIRNGEVLLNRAGATESLPLIKKNRSGNRALITFSSPPSQVPAQQLAAARTPTINASNARNRTSTAQPSQKPDAPNGPPRKIRRPNFSGLDKALKKMGEI